MPHTPRPRTLYALGAALGVFIGVASSIRSRREATKRRLEELETSVETMATVTVLRPNRGDPRGDMGRDAHAQ